MEGLNLNALVIGCGRVGSTTKIQPSAGLGAKETTPHTIPNPTTVAQAMAQMTKQRVRHLPVVKDGRPLGIVSLRLLSRWAFESVQRAQ